jgi:hypothetical protein
MTDRTQNDAREASFSERMGQLSEDRAISCIFAVSGVQTGSLPVAGAAPKQTASNYRFVE